MMIFPSIQIFQATMHVQFQRVNMKSKNIHWIWRNSDILSQWSNQDPIVSTGSWSKMMLLYVVSMYSDESLKNHKKFYYYFQLYFLFTNKIYRIVNQFCHKHYTMDWSICISFYMFIPKFSQTNQQQKSFEIVTFGKK